MILLKAVVLIQTLLPAFGFFLPHQRRSATFTFGRQGAHIDDDTTATFSSTRLHQSSAAYSQAQALKRRGITIPLLDLTSSSTSSTNDSIITPLPASHLPSELTTLNVYGMELKAAIHKMMIDEATSKVSGLMSTSSDPALAAAVGSDMMGDVFGARDGVQALYGHLVGKPEDEEGNESDSGGDVFDSASPLVGSIGCAAEVVIAMPSTEMQVQTMDDAEMGLAEDEDYSDFRDPLNDSTIGGNSGEDKPFTVVMKGSFRFVVREVTQTFPYPIAIVDEILDDESPQASYDESSLASDQKETEGLDDDDDDDDDDDYDMYADIPYEILIPRTISAMKTIVDQKLSTKPKTISPLEQSILEESGIPQEVASGMEAMKQNQNEEMAAILDVFQSSLIDFAPSPSERFFAVGMLAAEFGGADNALRKKILFTTNGVKRIRLVLEALEQKISMVQAKKLTKDIVEQSDEGSKELQVGDPSLPPWVKGIKKGTKLDYFWSEKDGWLSGIVVDSVMVVDELIITVLFDDGETVKLPFLPDEKIRWRPGGMN